MTFSKQNFEQVRQAYEGIFDALERTLAQFGIDFYLIGAQSRDVWTSHLTMNKRLTLDIDFAVYVSGLGQWMDLTNWLIEKEKFVRDEKLPYRFYAKDGVLDLIPFGGIEQDDEVILQNPLMELSVFGCREVAENAATISGRYKVITLAGLCIMKLIAFDEKPDLRAKDWDDFLLVLTHYSEIAGEQLFEGMYEDLITEDFEAHVAAARMLGRHLQPILMKNDRLKERIKEILLRKLRNFSFEEIDGMYQVEENRDKLVVSWKLIMELLKGIED